jgi:hypothetical protein
MRMPVTDDLAVGPNLIEQRLAGDLDALLRARGARGELEERLVEGRGEIGQIRPAQRPHLRRLVEADELRHRDPVMAPERADHLRVADDELDLVVEEQRVDGRQERLHRLLGGGVEVERRQGAAHDAREERRDEIQRLGEDDDDGIVLRHACSTVERAVVVRAFGDLAIRERRGAVSRDERQPRLIGARLEMLRENVAELRHGARFSLGYSVQPSRYWRRTYAFASSSLVTFIASPSHRSRRPGNRTARLPISTISESGPE